MTETIESLRARATAVGLQILPRPDGFLVLHSQGKLHDHDACYRAKTLESVATIIEMFEKRRR